MKLGKVTLLALITLACGLATVAEAVTPTSSFDSFRYTYTLTPEAGEQIRSFHIYTGLAECDPTHYYNLELPAGWAFDSVALLDKCVLTFFTVGEPLPVGETATIAYTHYCAPCCHSWYVSDEGSTNPTPNVIDDDEQHSEPCNIPAEFSSACGGPGLLLAPIYPVSVDNETNDWGSIKAQYR